MKLEFKLIIFLVLFGSINSYAKPVSELAIGGSYYQKIVQVKDVIAEVLPPPAYIVESYLMTFLLLNETEKALKDKKIDAREMKSINRMAEKLRQLKEGVSENAELEGYYRRVEIWNRDLNQPNEKLKKLRELMIRSAEGPVKDFFKTVDMKFIPAIKEGDMKKAEAAHTLLNEKFLEHKIIIDEIVALAKKSISEFEMEAATKESAAVVKGPIYNNIILMKDLISDVISPTSFIIESYLNGWEMIYEVKRNGQSAKFKKLREESEQLKASYISRHLYWSKNLKMKELRDVMIKDAYFPVQKFYTVFDHKLVPALEKGKVDVAKKIMNVMLTSLFQQHRRMIDKLVFKADNKAIEIESEMALQLVRPR